MKSTFKKIILFVLIIAVIITIAILIFGKKKTATELLTTQSPLTTTASPASDQSAKFLQSLSQVKSINLDTTFFNNKAYQKLIDFSIPIVLEDQRLVGRPNPFAPLGVDSFFSQPDTTTTTTPTDTTTTNKKK